MRAGGAWRLLAVNLVLTLSYWGLTRLAVHLFDAHAVLPMPFWPGAALGLAAGMLGGWRWAPGILLGSGLAHHLALETPLALACSLALGNTLVPFWMATEIRRRASRMPPFFTLADVARFVGFGALLAPALAGFWGVCSLLLWGRADPAAAGELWLRWWVGHASGVFILAPLFLCCWYDRRLLSGTRLLEFLFVSGGALVLAVAVFFGIHAQVHPVIGLHFLLILPLAWVAIRFPPREVAFLLPLLMAVAAWGTLEGLGPFVHAGNARLLLTVGLLAMSLAAACLLISAISAERQDVLTSLASSEARQRTIFSTASVGIALADFEGRLLEVNGVYGRMLGYEPTEMLGMRVSQFTHPEDSAQELDFLAAIARGERDTYQMEKRYISRDGREFWVELSVGCQRDPEGRPLHLIGVVSDITERKRDQAALRLMGEVFRQAGEAILVTDHDNRIVMVNQAFTALTGYAPEEVLGKNPRLLSAGRTSRETYRKMWVALHQRGHWQGEVWDRRKDGGVYPKLLSISVLKDARGRVTHHIASFTDISEHKEAEDRIRYLALHDTLTGLPNRLSLQERLSQALQTAERRREMLGVIFVDLDRFKLINDTLGHHAGDAMLIQLGRRLQQNVRSNDVVARLGGDEFVVVVTGADDVDTVLAVAEKLLEALRQPYQIEGQLLHTTPSLGLSFYPRDGKDVESLMRNADVAMYHAKSRGRNGLQCYEPALNLAASDRLSLESRLPRALAGGEFRLYYQPKVDGQSGCLAGVEALVRWQDPERGMVPPDRFIPVAEETGLIVPLGAWVLEEACRQRRAWYDQGLPAFRVAVNLSPLQSRQEDFLSHVAALLAQYGLQPGDLELEITESAAMRDPLETIGILKRIKEMGISLAIDDFGTGYSSLAYLKLLPIDTLKLDRSFVQDIDAGGDDAVICSATIALAHALGLAVVAEGVENAAQEDYLLRLGCDQLQGYRFSKPLPAAELELLLAGLDEGFCLRQPR